MVYKKQTISSHEKYIKRCLELALLGRGNVSPNPMVGAVIVYNHTIIGEGYHMRFGGAHAEVNAINAVKDKSLLQKSIIYVSLEPCSHHGKTPPCADLIIKSKIPHVVIASMDSNAVVCGNGINKLKIAGIRVEVGILEEEAKTLNVAFNLFQTKKRPHIILKWAESADGFIDTLRDTKHGNAAQISNSISSLWVHKMRSETDAILVGRNTVNVDNPSLTTRKWFGKNPLRVIIDSNLTTKRNRHVFNGEEPTLIFNVKENRIQNNLEWIKLDSSKDLLPQLLTELHFRKIQSLLVEGGAFTTQQFIDNSLFDKCVIIKSEMELKKGVKAPQIDSSNFKTLKINNDQLFYYG